MKNFTQIPNSIIRSRLSPTAKTLFNVLASYNPSFPSYKELLKQVGVSRTTLSNAIKELVNRNIIVYQKGSLTSRKANQYSIKPESEWQLGLEIRPKKKESDPSVQKIDRRSVQNLDSNNTNINTNTVVQNLDRRETVSASLRATPTNNDNPKEEENTNCSVQKLDRGPSVWIYDYTVFGPLIDELYYCFEHNSTAVHQAITEFNHSFNGGWHITPSVYQQAKETYSECGLAWRTIQNIIIRENKVQAG